MNREASRWLCRSSAPSLSDISCPTTARRPGHSAVTPVDAPRTSGVQDRGITASRVSDSSVACAYAPVSQSSPWRTAYGAFSRLDGTDCAVAGHLPALPRIGRGRCPLSSRHRKQSSWCRLRRSAAASFPVRKRLDGRGPLPGKTPLHGRNRETKHRRPQRAPVLALQITGRRQAPASRCGPSPHPAPSSASFAQYLCAQLCRDAPAVAAGNRLAGSMGCPARLIEKPSFTPPAPAWGIVPIIVPCPTVLPTARDVAARPV